MMVRPLTPYPPPPTPTEQRYPDFPEHLRKYLRRMDAIVGCCFDTAGRNPDAIFCAKCGNRIVQPSSNA